MINRLKEQGRIFIMGLAVVLVVGLSTVSVFAANSTDTPKHDMSTMTSESMAGHSMENMTHDGQGGHDMKSIAPEDHSGHSMNNKDNPWPVLYGFGGAILAVIVVAGVMKFAGLKRLEGK